MTPPQIFDTHRLRLTRQRMMAGSWLRQELCSRLAERLTEINRSFAAPVTLADPGGTLAQAMQATGRILSCLVLDRAPGEGVNAAAESEALPLADTGHDLIAHALDLHWINDLPGHLAQVRRALRPDGLFLAVCLGGESLIELRESIQAAELGLCGGFSSRFSPVIDVRTAGMLLQRAGFTLPVVDRDHLTLTYAGLWPLIQDLRTHGLTNSLVQRPRRPPPRQLFDLAEQLYQTRFATETGRLPLTLEVLYLTGWAPDQSQQKPLARGSGLVSLHDVLR